MAGVGVSHFSLALLLVMTTFSAATAATRLPNPTKPRPCLEPISPGGYRTYIIILAIPAGSDHMDYAAHRAWHESFLPSKTTRDGRPRLRHSYISAVTGFSALFTDEEVKHVADKPGVLNVIANGIIYLHPTRPYRRRHRRRRASQNMSLPAKNNAF